jgi:hypothetical protein
MAEDSNNIENEKIISDMNEFIKPKLVEMQELILSNNSGLFDLLKKMKKYMKDINEEYKNIYNRSFDDDIKKLGGHFGNKELLDLFKKNY